MTHHEREGGRRSGLAEERIKKEKRRSKRDATRVGKGNANKKKGGLGTVQHVLVTKEHPVSWVEDRENQHNLANTRQE